MHALAVSGMCGGNTNPAEDVDCSAGDGTNPAKTHNRGPTANGTTVVECCVYPGPCVGHHTARVVLAVVRADSGTRVDARLGRGKRSGWIVRETCRRAFCCVCRCGAAFNMTSSRFDWTCQVTADNCITDGSADGERYAAYADCAFEVLSTGVLTSMEHNLHSSDPLTINGEHVLAPRGVLPVEANGATIQWQSDHIHDGSGWTICWSPGASGPLRPTDGFPAHARATASRTQCAHGLALRSLPGCWRCRDDDAVGCRT